MTREEVLNSKQLKKRFCKDLNLPVSVFENPYFMQRLETADSMHPGTLAKWNRFVESLRGFASEQEYFEYYNSVKDTVINDIQAQQGYHALQDAVFSWESGIARIGEMAFPAEPWESSVRRNLYSEFNCGRNFISIDMHHANFTAMQAFAPDIFGSAKTWEEYIAGFTDMEHIINSKYIRQVIFGACNPKRQVRVEQWLMLNALWCLKYHHIDASLYSLTGDEIILYDDNGMDFDELDDALKDAYVYEVLKAEGFLLKKIHGTDGYIRHSMGGGLEFKGLESELWHQVAKYHDFQPITDDDLVFMHNGRLAKFLEPIPNPFDGDGEN